MEEDENGKFTYGENWEISCVQTPVLDDWIHLNNASRLLAFICASVAKCIRHWPPKPGIVGSSPIWGANQSSLLLFQKNKYIYYMLPLRCLWGIRNFEMVPFYFCTLQSHVDVLKLQSRFLNTYLCQMHFWPGRRYSFGKNDLNWIGVTVVSRGGERLSGTWIGQVRIHETYTTFECV